MSEFIKENLDEIIENVKEACKKVSRDTNEVKIIGVTKTVDIEYINESINFGITDIAENKVQELVRKYEDVKKVNWHLIGTLQTNKVKYIIDKVSLIHSLDRIELAKEIDKRAKKIDRVIPCLVQVNISSEESKHGLPLDKVKIGEFVKYVSENFNNIKLIGFMGMASFEENPEDTRQYFKNLKMLKDDFKKMNIKNTDFKHLSMGMSNDYKIAVEEGATLLRIGSLIYGKRNY